MASKASCVIAGAATGSVGAVVSAVVKSKACCVGATGVATAFLYIACKLAFTVSDTRGFSTARPMISAALVRSVGTAKSRPVNCLIYAALCGNPASTN